MSYNISSSLLLPLFASFLLNVFFSNGIFGKFKIYNGNAVSNNTEFPWMATLQYSQSSMHMWALMCTGTIVADQWILTAAHCKHEVEYIALQLNTRAQFAIGFGATNLFEQQRISINMSMIVMHPHFRITNANQLSIHKDLMLIKLPRKLHFNATVKPIRLSGNVPTVNTTVTIAGWGMDKRMCHEYPIPVGKPPTELQYGQAYMLGDKEPCVRSTELAFLKAMQRNVNETVPAWAEEWALQLNREAWVDKICVNSNPSVALHGDSGGPLLIHKNTTIRQVGVASLAPPDCKNKFTDELGFANIPFTNTYTKLDCKWIANVTAGSVQCDAEKAS